MGRSIPQEVIDQIRMRADIVEVIQGYIPLKKAGRDYKACCPFHQEKTPSFTVSQERQYFHCFGCGKHGNAIGFVMERENVDFPTALRILAQKYAIDIPEQRESYHVPREERKSFKDRLYLLHDLMRKFYVENLARNPMVAQYLESRGLPDETVRRFGLGASLDSWDSALRFGLAHGFTEEELHAGGIIKLFEDNPSKKYDMFRNRLMFPIQDEMGRVVGFSARTIEANPQGMKYVNTPETSIFKKGRILYGMHIARAEMGSSQKKFAILCEGQLDVIAMHRAGFPNTVAPQGTAFTPEQAMMLKRCTDRLYLATDSDAAGTKAIFRDAEIALPIGLELKVVRFPGGKDPDELLRNSGSGAIEEAVGNAVDFFEFSLRHFTETNGTSPSGIAMTAETMLGFIRLLESDVAKASYLSWLSEKTGINPEPLFQSMNRRIEQDNRRAEYRRPEPDAVQPPPLRPPENENFLRTLRELLRCLLSNEKAASAAASALKQEILGRSPTALAIDEVIQAQMLDEWAEAPKQILQKYSGEIDGELSALLMNDMEPVGDAEAKENLFQCLKRLYMVYISKNMEENLEKVYACAGAEQQELVTRGAKLARGRSRISTFRAKNWEDKPDLFEEIWLNIS